MQVIVYAGAVMTLFLFVIMLIGVDKAEDTAETLPGQRTLVWSLLGTVTLFGLGVAMSGRFDWLPLEQEGTPIPNGTIEAVARPMFGEWILAFEVTAILLTIAAAGAVALAFFRRGRGVDEVVE